MGGWMVRITRPRGYYYYYNFLFQFDSSFGRFEFHAGRKNPERRLSIIVSIYFTGGHWPPVKHQGGGREEGGKREGRGREEELNGVIDELHPSMDIVSSSCSTRGEINGFNGLKRRVDGPVAVRSSIQATR